jgi:hypothetical protein
MLNFAISELWHNKTVLAIHGLVYGDIVRVNEKYPDKKARLNSGSCQSKTSESELFFIEIPFGSNNLEKLSAVEIEHISADVIKVFDLSSILLKFIQDGRILVTGFQKPPSKESSRIAALTIAYNEEYMLSKWANYYGQIFGYENLFVIDDGSDINPRTYLNEAVNVIRQPRPSFNSWRLCRTLSKFQRILLETYDIVIELDSDEFILTDRPDCDTIKDHIHKIFPNDVGIIRTEGWELVHLIDREPLLNNDQPIAQQRNYLLRNTGFDKPVVTNKEISLIIGNHWCYENAIQDTSLIMLHLRHFDVNFSLEKIRKYKQTAWAEIDLANGFSNHQRIKEEELLGAFHGFVKSYQEAVDKGDMSIAKTLPEKWRRQLLLVDKNI